MHWCHQQISVHSSILKEDCGKAYHVYLSNGRLHDQFIVRCVLDEMLTECGINTHEAVIIESNNCSNQYKSESSFPNLQELANSLNVPLIRIYGIAGHRKGEVDHVGVLCKRANAIQENT